MLTVKVISATGSESIFETKSISWNSKNHSLKMEGYDIDTYLWKGDHCYVMNASGNTISSYIGDPSKSQIKSEPKLKNDEFFITPNYYENH